MDHSLTRRITRGVHVAESTASIANFPSPSATNLVRNSNATNTNRLSLFHKNTVAFAPDPDAIPADIDAIANLPSPQQVRRETKVAVPAGQPVLSLPWLTGERRFMQRASEESREFYMGRGYPTRIRHGKLQLPPPYKTHRAEIMKRMAKRDFIYGRDEDYLFSERDNRVKSSCCGVLYFHTIELLDLVVNRQSFVDSIPVSYYCNISIGKIKRTTKIVHSQESHQIKMDSGVHLAIEVSQWREAPTNRLRLELWSFQDPEAHFIVGTVEMHIYNFIRLQHMIDSCNLWSDGICVGKLAYETAFSYGAFGYGHSNQLMNFSQPLMETISHSMFPRIKLDEEADLFDKAFQARKPENLKMFTYHSFILEMDDVKDPHVSAMFGRPRTGKNIKLEPKPVTVQQVEFKDGIPIHCKLHMNIYQKVMQADFNDMFGEYVCLGHKRERLEYLANMVPGRMRDMYETEVGPIYEYLPERDLDKIHRRETVPGEILFPKKVPCTYSEPFELNEEDEQFQNKHFPTVRRETGYLASMFGFEKKSEAEEFLNDMDYPAYKQAKLPKLANITVQNCTWLVIEWMKRTFLRLKAFSLKLWGFIFPEIMHELPVLHISVTVATPQASTTNVYSYFAREGKESTAKGKVDGLVKQTTALIGMTRKQSKWDRLKAKERDGMESDDSSSFDTDDEETLKDEVMK